MGPVWVQIFPHSSFRYDLSGTPLGSDQCPRCSFRLNLLGALAWAPFGFRSSFALQLSFEPFGGPRLGTLWVHIISYIAVFV